MTVFKTLDDLAVTSKRVLVRVDFNVPLKCGRVADATRIERTAPTLTQLADLGARVIVLSHLGRPKGRVVKELSLSSLAEALGQIDNSMDGVITFDEFWAWWVADQLEGK